MAGKYLVSGIVNVRRGWRSAHDRLSTSEFAENLLDMRYYRATNTITAKRHYVRAEHPGFYGLDLGFNL